MPASVPGGGGGLNIVKRRRSILLGKEKVKISGEVLCGSLSGKCRYHSVLVDDPILRMEGKAGGLEGSTDKLKPSPAPQVKETGSMPR